MINHLFAVMRSYSLFAPAKINLYLEIIGDRTDGYHELAMVLQSVNLADRVEIRSIGIETIRVHCDHPQVPTNETNLAYRAAKLLAKEFPEASARYGGVEIRIEKRIPVAAGLAGGSTNAAAVLVGLDLLWKLGLTQGELQTLAAQLGSDIPFCISGGTALATGRGDQLSPLGDLRHLSVVLAKYRSLEVSTQWAYQTYRQQFGHTYCDPADIECRHQRVHSGPMVSAISHRDYAKIGQLLHNDLEQVVLPAYPQVVWLRETFASLGVLGTMMSGSGPTVFALTESPEQAQAVAKEIKHLSGDSDLEVWVSEFIPNGISLINS